MSPRTLITIEKNPDFFISVGTVRLCRNDLRAVYVLVAMIVLSPRVQSCMRYGTNPLDRKRECTINLDWRYNSAETFQTIVVRTHIWHIRHIRSYPELVAFPLDNYPLYGMF